MGGDFNPMNSIRQMEAIILAAGYSSRAANFKMILKLGELTILEHTLSKFEEVCNKVIIVGGYQCKKIKEVVSQIRERNKYSMEIKIVLNEHFDQGMFSSIQRGCREVQSPTFFITPGDCPVVNKKTIQELAIQKDHVVIPSYLFKGGHPIKLTKEVKMKILEAEEHSNLRQELQEYDKCFVNVEDPGILMDIDTPEDYKKVMKYFEELGKEADNFHKTNKTE